MTHDITEYDENMPLGDSSAPPLCLVHYYAERAAYPPERNPKPPGDRWIGRVAERRGNLIILEFAPPPAPTAGQTKATRWRRLKRWGYDALVLLLLLACLAGCLAAFRF